MLASVTETTGEIRGIQVRWVSVIVSGHTVEQVLSYDIAEAERVHERPFDDETDRFMQMGMFATDRIATDGTMYKVASATSYVLDGKCIRTAKIEHCDEVKPDSASWVISRVDGTPVEQQPWSCVPGTPPIAHRELARISDTEDFGEESDEHMATSLGSVASLAVPSSCAGSYQTSISRRQWSLAPH